MNSVSALERARERIDSALAERRRLILRGGVISESAEEVLQYAVERVFALRGCPDLAGPVHSGIRELVQNSAKAGLKRLLFSEMQLDPANPDQYAQVMDAFRGYLVESRRKTYRPRMRSLGFYVDISFVQGDQVVVVCVSNRFGLFPEEEQRIREKFALARKFDNLYDFYLQFGDITEGAGMGIAMVEILLQTAGIARHNFTVFGTESETVARMIIPLDPAYRGPRERFAQEMERRGCSAEELRSEVRAGRFSLPLF